MYTRDLNIIDNNIHMHINLQAHKWTSFATVFLINWMLLVVASAQFVSYNSVNM
jgi:hypothetical protein